MKTCHSGKRSASGIGFGEDVIAGLRKQGKRWGSGLRKKPDRRAVGPPAFGEDGLTGLRKTRKSGGMADYEISVKETRPS
jgi:hypothetical protein